MKTKSYSGKVAAITGAGSGMGRSLAVNLARRGCEVALSDIDERSLAETVGLVKNVSSVRVTHRKVDVADAAAVKAWADQVAKDHGRVNLVFNNAGISYAATVEGYDDADFERIIDICFWGVVHGTRAFLPHLVASGDGHVVNTSSVFGIVAFPGQSSYNAAKFAVRGYTEALRVECEIKGSPVSATCIHPGGIKTNIAKASKVHESMRTLGIDDLEGASKRFEKAFRLSADDAAEIILRGVAKNARRVLVGADAHVIDLVQRVLPGRYHGVIARIHHRINVRLKKKEASLRTTSETRPETPKSEPPPRDRAADLRVS
jgi:NAD(P)-dependent dehydrogenase (short-subunit alcohol dehydrogenase family)